MDYHGDLYLYNVCLGSNKNILLLVLVCQLAHLPPRHHGLDKGGNSDCVGTSSPSAVAASRLCLLQKFLSLWPSNALLFTLVKSFQLTRSSRTN